MQRAFPRRSKGAGSGFTFVELMVSMFVLIMIMAMVMRFFQQSTAAWDTSDRRARLNLTARAILSYLATEVSESVYDSNNTKRINTQNFQSPGPYEFWTLNGTNWSAVPGADPFHEAGARRVLYWVQYGNKTIAPGQPQIPAGRLIRTVCAPGLAGIGMLTNQVLLDTVSSNSTLVLDGLDMEADPSVPAAYVDILLRLRTYEDALYHGSGTVYQTRAYLHSRNRYSLN